MTRLTPTGLSRLSPDDDTLEIRSSSGQTFRLRPQGRISADAMRTLLGGAPPPDAPQIIGPDLGSTGASRPYRDPTTGATTPGELTEEQLIAAGAAVRDPTTGHLRVGDPIRGRLGYDTTIASREERRIQSVALQEQQLRQRQRQKVAQEALERDFETGVRHLRERGASPEEIAEFTLKLNQEYPEAISVSPPSRLVADLIEDDNPELKRSTLIDLRKEYEATKDETLIPEISSRMSDIYDPGTARAWEDQEYQRRDREQDRATERYRRRANELKLGTTFSMTTSERVPNFFLPSFLEDRKETEHVFGISDRNPFKTGTKEHTTFSTLQAEAKRQVADAQLKALEDEFGPLDPAEHPESVSAAEAEVKAREDAAVPPPTGPGARYPTLTEEQAAAQYQQGTIRAGDSFFVPNGELHQINIDGTTTIIPQ